MDAGRACIAYFTGSDLRRTGAERLGCGMVFSCRMGCAACCIAPSISSPIPGMPHGKPAGVRCIQLDLDNKCQLFGLEERPLVCKQLTPSPEMCGEQDDGGHHARLYLARLEKLTAPD